MAVFFSVRREMGCSFFFSFVWGFFFLDKNGWCVFLWREDASNCCLRDKPTSST
jgi:hypothetical protein